LPCPTIRTRAITKPLFSDISNVRVFVDDLTAAVEFYRDLLGLPLRFQTPDFALFDTGTATLMIEPGGDDPDDGALVGRFTGISLTTGDLAATYATLRERGVDFLHPPERQPWGIVTHFCDPSGNVLSAVEYVR
jgi:predicted enzyme related to lactoylglutathione lyase